MTPQQAKARAKYYAVTWVRENKPELWEEMLDAAYEDYGIPREPTHPSYDPPKREWKTQP